MFPEFSLEDKRIHPNTDTFWSYSYWRTEKLLVTTVSIDSRLIRESIRIS